MRLPRRRHAGGLWAVEYAVDIADVYRKNFPSHDCRTSKVEDVDPASLPWVNHIHASPVCKEFSKAKTGGVEGEIDIAAARSVCNILEHLHPDTFTLENVWMYRNSASFAMILRCLEKLGYIIAYSHLNSADVGVPQTRKRLILRASKDLLPPLPAPVRWVGWYEAIEDLLPSLPESQFAFWQIERMPEALRSVMVTNSHETGFGNKDRGPQLINAEVPSHTLSTSHCSKPTRAFLARVNGECGELMIPSQIPSATISAGHVPDKHRAWLSQGRVVKMTARALARFQSIPDWYELPDNNKLAGTIIGNGWSSLWAQRIAESFAA